MLSAGRGRPPALRRASTRARRPVARIGSVTASALPAEARPRARSRRAAIRPGAPAGHHRGDRGLRGRRHRPGPAHLLVLAGWIARPARRAGAARGAADRRGAVAGRPPRRVLVARGGPDRHAPAGPGAAARRAALAGRALGGPYGGGVPAGRGRLRGPCAGRPVRAGGGRAGAASRSTLAAPSLPQAVLAGFLLALVRGRPGRGARAGPVGPAGPAAARPHPRRVPRLGRGARRAGRGRAPCWRRIARHQLGSSGRSTVR